MHLMSRVMEALTLIWQGLKYPSHTKRKTSQTQMAFHLADTLYASDGVDTFLFETIVRYSSLLLEDNKSDFGTRVSEDFKI